MSVLFRCKPLSLTLGTIRRSALRGSVVVPGRCKTTIIVNAGVTSPEDIINECAKIRESIQSLNDVSDIFLIRYHDWILFRGYCRDTKARLKSHPKKTQYCLSSSCLVTTPQANPVLSIMFATERCKRPVSRQRMICSPSLCPALLMLIGMGHLSLAIQIWVSQGSVPTVLPWFTVQNWRCDRISKCRISCW